MSIDLASKNADQLSVGFIGCGRLGKALAWGLSDAGLRVTCVSSSMAEDALALVARIPPCQVTTSQTVVDKCDLVFITTPDSIIEPTASALRWRAGQAAVHCSGVTEVSALDAARASGAFTGGFHPMQTFGDPDAAMKSLPGSTITIEADEPLNEWLGHFARKLGCSVNRLPPGMRGRYHAAAGVTSQFINALFAEAATLWKSWGATEESALRALLPLARGTLSSIESAGIARGMPGPVSRGDVASIEKHVEALDGLGPEMMAFYRILCSSTVKLALGNGVIDAATAAQFTAALKAEKPGAHH